MAESAPIRPQRIIRSNRETTGGLLMSVIRSLTTSRDSADRDRERLELEKGFQQCDTKLNELISEHGNDLYQVMTTFSRILTNLSRAKERLVDTRDKLMNCQKLLHCKRDELKKLWLEIVENRAVYDLLERVEQVSSLSSQVDAFQEKKHYLHAGQCCVDGLRQLEPSQPMEMSTGHEQSQINNSLSQIEALQEVRIELLSKKEILFDKCIDELHRHLYAVVTEQIRKRFQQDPTQIRAKTSAGPQNHQSETSLFNGITRSSNDNNGFDAYPEEDSAQFITMLTKCIGLLNKIPDAVKIIKERFDEEFVNVVIRTAQDILVSTRVLREQETNAPTNDSNDPKRPIWSYQNEDLVVLTSSRLLAYRYDPFSHLNTEPEQQRPSVLPKQSQQLQQLFDLLMKQFYHVMKLHESIVLFNLKRIQCGLHADCSASLPSQNDQSSSAIGFYSTSDIWSKIQLLIQQLLDYYLDISQISGQSSSSALGSSMNYNLVSSLLSSTAVNMLFGSTHHSSNEQSQPIVSGPSNNSNYSSFFLKRRPMMVTNAMNAMNVVMSTGKNTLNTLNSSAQTDPLNDTNEGNAAGELLQQTTGGQHQQSVVHWRSAQSNLFKFDHSTQAISWNSFLQHQDNPSSGHLGDGDHNPLIGNNNDDESDRDQVVRLQTSGSGSGHNAANINSKLFDSLQCISGQSPDNLVLLYDSLLEHMEKCPLSHAERSSLGNSLQSYLCSSADRFTEHISSQLDAMLEQAHKSLESGESMVLISNTEQCDQRPIRLLQSAVLVDVAVRELSALMCAMSHYRQHYLGYICNVLTSFKDTTKRIYETITCETNCPPPLQPNIESTAAAAAGMATQSNPHTVLSAYWARNEDINRLLKSQPNWIQVQSQSTANDPLKIMTTVDCRLSDRFSRLKMSSSSSFEECSPEDVRQRNASEIDILMNLLSQEITRNELLWSEGQLRLLANLHQSLEWLSARCDHLVQIMQRQMDHQNDKANEVYWATLNQLSSDLNELAQLSLMVLHLEVRVHCCYHLQALDTQFFTTPAPSAGLSSEPMIMGCELLSDDGRIMPLLDDLQRMFNEVSASQLPASKMSYIFEGLGQLMAKIFINSVMSVRRLKANGVKRACRAIYDIQRRLSTITKSRELALDYARQYFEMLLLNPDEILSTIIERGPQFTSQEYVSAITLLHNKVNESTDGTSYENHQNQHVLQRLLKRLENILAEVTQ